MTYPEFKARYALTPDPQQEAAILRAEGPTLLLAVPGSGKTTVLIHRLGYLIFCLGVAPEQILTVTYTVAATRDMAARFARTFGETWANRLEFRTINGLSARIIQHYERVKGRQAFTLVTEEGRLAALVGELYRKATGEFAAESTVRSFRTAITYCKNRQMTQEEIEAYQVEELHDRDVASAAEALLACELGASVVRTHNVEMTVAALKDLRPAVLLGLGSNVALVAEPGEETEAKIAQLNLAVGQLCSLPDTQIVDMSSFYESEPAYYEDQDAFVNAVVLLRSGLPPKELLGYLHSIENSLGRVRAIENGPRTLDIDILDYQMYVASDDELTLPHPRVTERDFVVKPLLEILPGWELADGTPVGRVPEAQRVGKARRI